jgi:hypothetical protein
LHLGLVEASRDDFESRNMIGPGVKISTLLLKNCVSEIHNNSINNHRSIIILTLLKSGRQGLSNGIIIRPNFVVRERSKHNLRFP